MAAWDMSRLRGFIHRRLEGFSRPASTMTLGVLTVRVSVASWKGVGMDVTVAGERPKGRGSEAAALTGGSVSAMPSPFVELEVGERLVRVSNPDKILFPARKETKLDLVRYYLSVADGIVRALYERPTQLRRFPDGVEGEAIYQKRVPEKRPEWVEAARVRFPSGRHADELCVTEVAQVAWAANLATIDFHPWPSRRRDTERPDELRIDVDPQPGTTFRDAKRIAGLVHEVLDEIGYSGWPKTSGNRGVHVLCRIEPNWEFPVVRRCALAFAREVERRAPKKVTTAWWKEERGKRVFIDFNQNARDRTIASAYSVRARKDATVSAPVTWDELPDVETEDFTMATMPSRFARLGDLHETIDAAVCDLRVLLEWVEREEQEGVGEAPYPPNFPKMPGEPPRVQPSRARKS
jgi:DNA ligase D